MNIKDIKNKEEILEYFVKKAGADKLELETLWVEFETAAKEWGLEGDDILLHIKTRLNSTYRKKLSSNAVEKKDIFIYGVSKTDYGAKRTYDLHLKKYKADADTAFRDGYVNEKGDPVYKGRAFGDGEIINVDTATVLIIHGLEKSPEGIKRIEITTRNKDEKIDLFSFYNTRVVPKKTRDSGVISFGCDSTTKFIKSTTLTDSEFMDFIAANLKPYIVTLANFKEAHEKVADDFDRLFIIKGNVADVSISATANNRIEIDELNDEWEEGQLKTINCWYESGLPIPPVGATNVIVFGRSSVNKDGVCSMGAYGIFIPEMFKKKADIKPVNGDSVDVEEEETDDVWGKD